MNRYLLPRRALVIWFVVLLSPTEWLFLLALDDRYHWVTGRPGNLVEVIDSLTVLIPFVALAACGCLVWRSSMTVWWKAGWIAFTILAMLLQVAFWLAIIIAETGYAPAP